LNKRGAVYEIGEEAFSEFILHLVLAPCDLRASCCRQWCRPSAEAVAKNLLIIINRKESLWA
jgi:hypothetical protein